MASVVSPEPELLSAAQEIMHLEREYLVQNYSRYPLALHRGKGCYVYDLDGNRYLDLISRPGYCCTPPIFTITNIKASWRSVWRKSAD
jgi:glutamate-1-semialdehyde aminotransferase